jgi:hypothetical protein
MGREVKRVDLNNPPAIGQIWHGYINPFEVYAAECPACDNGYSRIGKLYNDQWYGNAPFDPAEYGAKPLALDDETLRYTVQKKVEWSIEESRRTGRFEYYTGGGVLAISAAIQREIRRMHELYKGMWCHHLIQADVDALIAEGRLWELTSTFTSDVGRQEREGAVVTAEQVNAWSIAGMGHDSFNSSICVSSRCARDGVAIECSECGGTSVKWESAERKARYDEWKAFEPPAGDGYQVWDTVSEGKPISPAFATQDELARWMLAHGGPDTAGVSFEGWLRFIKAGWAPTGVGSADGFMSGVEAIAAAE